VHLSLFAIHHGKDRNERGVTPFDQKATGAHKEALMQSDLSQLPLRLLSDDEGDLGDRSKMWSKSRQPRSPRACCIGATDYCETTVRTGSETASYGDRVM